MAIQWPGQELASGVSSKLPLYKGHVLQKAIAILLPYLQEGLLGEKGPGGLYTLLLLLFLSPSTAQPQAAFSIFMM